MSQIFSETYQLMSHVAINRLSNPHVRIIKKYSASMRKLLRPALKLEVSKSREDTKVLHGMPALERPSRINILEKCVKEC